MSLDTKIASLPIGTQAGDAAKAAGPASAEGQRLARVAGEFESMLLLQMLREMRKSGSWKDEDEEKDARAKPDEQPVQLVPFQPVEPKPAKLPPRRWRGESRRSRHLAIGITRDRH